MSLSEYQENIRLLAELRLNEETLSEWRTKMDENIYSPRLDVAVGPFAIENGIMLTQEYNQMMGDNEELIRSLVITHLWNIKEVSEENNAEEIENAIAQKITELRYTNENPRCFLAIEIENEVSRKHLMGGALNAAALGRIAIAVGYTEEKHRAFLNLYRYFAFLEQVHKPTFRVNNLLVISGQQLLNALTP